MRPIKLVVDNKSSEGLCAWHEHDYAGADIRVEDGLSVIRRICSKCLHYEIKRVAQGRPFPIGE